jgi:hypothetical protein
VDVDLAAVSAGAGGRKRRYVEVVFPDGAI